MKLRICNEGPGSFLEKGVVAMTSEQMKKIFIGKCGSPRENVPLAHTSRTHIKWQEWHQMVLAVG